MQIEYADKELKDLYAAADIVISRAGANVICELLAMRKPNLLIPLSSSASRGDQILNAESFERQGYSMVLKEEDMNKESLVDAAHRLYEERDSYTERMSGSELLNAAEKIASLIEEYGNNQF